MCKLFHTTAALSVLLATLMAANAADVPPYASPPPVYAPPVYVPPAFFSWTGFYLGGNIGGAWRHDNVSDGA
jgi:outer membrane immunogenic protein